MKKLFFITLFIILGLQPVFAQFPDDPTLKGKAFDSLRTAYLFNKVERAKIKNHLEKTYQKTKDKEILAYLELMDFSINMSDIDVVDEFSRTIEQKYNDYPNIKAMAYKTVGYYYFWAIKNYEKAFITYLELEKLIDIYNPSVITNYALYCGEIATAYYKFRNYNKAIEFAKLGSKFAKDNWDQLNTIGLCFIKMGKQDSAIYYLKKAAEASKNTRNPAVYKAIANGNIGTIYYNQGKFQQAKPLLEADYYNGIALGENGLVAGSAIQLADIHILNKKFEVADSLLKQARAYITISRQIERLVYYYPVKSRYFEQQGDFKKALLYRDSTISATNKNDSTFNSLLLMRVQQRSDFEKLLEEKSIHENYKKILKVRIFAAIVIMSSIVIIIIVFIWFRARNLKNKKKIEALKKSIQLRQRLSADIHDDIGSTLSSISLYTQTLLMQSKNEAQQEILEKIKANTQNVLENLADIIWSVNPHMDVMKEVIARMRLLGSDLAEYANKDFTFQFDKEILNLQIEMSVRRNLFLIYKEALNNAIKYSNCTQLAVVISKNNDLIELTFKDNGEGFDQNKIHYGNGLLNMQARAKEMNGLINFYSQKNIGTTIILTFPIAINSQ